MDKITYKDIETANSKLVSTDIKGKPYMEVNQRIKAYRMLYPTGSITTSMISNENGVCIFKCNVHDESGRLLSTGTAYERENSSFINKTSYIENCESSAIGRALGIAGFGIDTSVASFEEVGNAIANQDEKKLVSPSQLKVLNGFDAEYLNKCLKRLGLKTLSELTVQQASEMIQHKNK